MKVAGIVAEFDPFHNGHKYLLERVRESGITHIAAAMSGDLTQRGDVSLFDKQARAICAVKNGADIVIELPPPFSCSCSEVFARAAVKLLAGLGVDMIAFGSEVTDKALLSECADISSSLSDNDEIKALTSSGLSYPKAISEYIKAHYGEEYSSVFSSPNATLGVEYIKAAREYKIPDFLPIARGGVSHDSDTANGGFASGSLLRQMVRENKDISAFTPLERKSLSPAFIENMEGHILFTLCQGDTKRLSTCNDINSQILESILRLPRNMPASLSELYERLKCKGVTLARLRRIALFLSAGLENVSADELNAARILAFNKRGTQLLQNARGGKIIFDTSLSRIEQSVPKIVQNINRGAYFRYLCTDKNEHYINEYTRKITIERE